MYCKKCLYLFILCIFAAANLIDFINMNDTYSDNKELIKRPLVSVVIPVYNAGELLRPCLDTLVNQTLRDIEIICVLDCPTDGSDKVVEEYAEKDDRIVVIRNEKNLNIGESRNVGLRAARGEYIGFSDHDDTRELDMYEKMYEATNNGEKCIVFSGQIVDAFLNHEFPTYLNNLMERIKQLPLNQQLFYSLIPRGGQKCRMHITPNIYNHRFAIQHNLHFVDTKECGAEDKLFLLSALAAIQNDDDISLMNHTFYLYRFHETNTHDAEWYIDRSHVINFLYCLHDLAKKNKWIDPIIYYSLFLVVQISELYTCFKRDIRQIGPANTLKTYRNLFNSSVILKDIISSTPLKIKGLTSAKRLFLLWAKRVIR